MGEKNLPEIKNEVGRGTMLGALFSYRAKTLN